MDSESEILTCLGKVKHRSYSDARYRIDISKKHGKGLGRAKGREVSPYKCPFCHYWHVGSQRKRGKR